MLSFMDLFRIQGVYWTRAMDSEIRMGASSFKKGSYPCIFRADLSSLVDHLLVLRYLAANSGEA